MSLLLDIILNMDEPFTHENVKQRATDVYGIDFSDSEVKRGFKKLKKT